MIRRLALLAVPLLALIGLSMVTSPPGTSQEAGSTSAGPPPDGLAAAVFAGGCFWCMEGPFDALPGVVSTVSGYTGGAEEQPTYKQVSAGATGHTEAVRVIYDPVKVSYDTLLEVFWKNIDPIAVNYQFCDRGTQYRSGIFVDGAEQRAAAERSKAELAASGKLPGPIATEITDAGAFWPAEDYHQDYYLKNPARYQYYRWGCGRDQRLTELWGEASH